jgi:hypothetical protein
MPTIKAKIGGVWTPVGGSGGGGTDEVWVSADAPTGTTQELWYDTDEPNLYDPDTARWNSAWGVIQTGTFIPGQGAAVTSGTVITSALTTQAGLYRRYRITCFARAVTMSANATVTFNLYRDGAGITDGYTNVLGQSTATPYGGMSFSWLVIGEAVARSWTVTLSTGGGVGVAAFYGTHWYIEDVGPYYLASSPPAQPASVWTNVTFQNGWTNYGSGFVSCQYRLFGDMVQVRGLMKGGAIGATPAFVLPAGCRPTGMTQFATQADGAFGWLSIDVDGSFRAQGGTSGAFNINCQFSVTP